MPSNRSKPRSTPFSAIATAGAIAILVYVSANLLVINLAPVIHYFTFTVEVTDRVTAAAIPDASVGWVHTNLRSGFRSVEPLGRTDPAGRLVLSATLQEQPSWMWPMLGHFKFGGRVFEVRANPYKPSEIRLDEALLNVPYSTHRGTVRVSLEQ